MVRWFLLFVLGFATWIPTTQIAAQTSQVEPDQEARYEFHVIGDVQAPGAHPSYLRHEMLVNLLKIARLFPAESYQLRLVRNGNVEWEADVPSDNPTPSVRLQADDILIVGSQQRLTADQKLSRNTDDSAEVAIVVPGQKVEFKFVTPGITAGQISVKTNAGQLKSVVPVAGDIHSNRPDQRVAQDGDVLVFTGPNPIEPETGGPSLAGNDAEEQSQGPELSGIEIPIIATGQSTQPHISTANLTTDPGVPTLSTQISPTTIPANQTNSNGDYVTDQPVQINSSDSRARERIVNPRQDEIGVSNNVTADNGQNAAQSDEGIDVLQTGIMISGSPTGIGPVGEPLSSFGMEQDVNQFGGSVTAPDAIRTALQVELDHRQTEDNPAPKLDANDTSTPFNSTGINDSSLLTTSQTDAVPLDQDTRIFTDAPVDADSTQPVSSVTQSTADLSSALGQGLADPIRSSTDESSDSSEASRRKYSSVVFVLLLLGSITSLIFIWSKKSDDSIENRLQRFKSFGDRVIPKVNASLPRASNQKSSIPKSPVSANKKPSEPVVNTASTLPSDRAEAASPVDSTAGKTPSVAETRLDRLIQNNVRVSRETNRMPRSFELNSEPLGPRRYRIDAAAPPIRGPHFQIPDPTKSQRENHDESHNPELAGPANRIDTPSEITVPGNHYGDVPEGTLDRALNSIEGVSRT